MNGIPYQFDEELMFEGEVINGKKWNGKGYDKKGNIIKEFINSKVKIKRYDFYGNLIFGSKCLNYNEIN